MKFNNQKRLKNKKHIYSILFIILFTIFVFVALTPIHNEKFNLIKYVFLVIALLIAVHIIIGNEYFEYDSTGMIVILKNDSIIKKDFFPLTVKTIEFPKEKLKDFKINNYIIYRSLSVYVSSKENGIIKQRFNITNISKKRAKYLKQSLKKVIRENTKH
jgi:hypothetical protein